MAKKVSEAVYEQVDASPVKSFFVSMLTRDILLTDAILDLLDNCVDGILRKKSGVQEGLMPYEGFYAEITYNGQEFSIHDNCGGIPWSLKNYAFRMGARNDMKRVVGGLGNYGIGMKRAIFKMGRRCSISTQSGEHCYDVEIEPNWIDDEADWSLPVKEAKRTMPEDGTTILIGDLHDGISAQFDQGAFAFTKAIVEKISTQFAFIIGKGFKVSVNDVAVKPRPIGLLFSLEQGEIKPYIYKTNVDDVHVFLSVGFTRPIPSQEDAQNEADDPRYSSIDAGWTVLCNDRAVLFCDKTELTGWGEASVPQYHTQFIAISGIVEFQSDNPAALPTTTTKRGIDSSSPLYLQVKNKMREGMLIFTNYTNKWKTDVKKSKEHMKSATLLSFSEIKTSSLIMPLSPVKKGPIFGEQYKPTLPLPRPGERTRKRISFVRDIKEIQLVGDYLLDDENGKPSVIGEKCFERILEEAQG